MSDKVWQALSFLLGFITTFVLIGIALAVGNAS